MIQGHSEKLAHQNGLILGSERIIAFCDANGVKPDLIGEPSGDLLCFMMKAGSALVPVMDVCYTALHAQHSWGISPTEQFPLFAVAIQNALQSVECYIGVRDHQICLQLSPYGISFELQQQSEDFVLLEKSPINAVHEGQYYRLNDNSSIIYSRH
ncbi:hypothetical protein TNCV_4522141 [Trichonephila clavipes]|nr:hypothetical protein TNCV_4522141 [Trichonephila clavipes]